MIPSPVLVRSIIFLRARIGRHALLPFISDVSIGAFQIEAITIGDLERCASLISKYSNLDLGLCDASVIAVAERHRTNTTLTVTNGTFRAIRSSGQKYFCLSPADYDRS